MGYLGDADCGHRLGAGNGRSPWDASKVPNETLGDAVDQQSALYSWGISDCHGAINGYRRVIKTINELPAQP